LPSSNHVFALRACPPKLERGQTMTGTPAEAQAPPRLVRRGLSGFAAAEADGRSGGTAEGTSCQRVRQPVVHKKTLPVAGKPRRCVAPKTLATLAAPRLCRPAFAPSAISSGRRRRIPWDWRTVETPLGLGLANNPRSDRPTLASQGMTRTSPIRRARWAQPLARIVVVLQSTCPQILRRIRLAGA
jgi:hypothetical protein